MEKYDASWCFEVLNAIDDLILVKGNKSKLLWANKSFLNYYGMTNEQLLDLVDAEHSDPDDTLKYVRDDEFVFESGKVLDVLSEPITNGAGEINYFHTVKAPIFDSHKGVIGTVGASRRVTESDIIESSIIERDDRKSFIEFQRDFLSRLNIPIIVLDAKNRVASFSEPAQEYLGFDPASAIGEFWDQFLEELMPLQKYFDFETHEVQEFHWNKDSKSRYCSALITPWYINKIEKGGSLIFLRDLTEQVSLRDALKYEQEQKIMSGKLKTLGEVAAGVGHEINNPLAVMTGLIRKIKIMQSKTDPDAPWIRDLDSIERNCFRISNIVKGLKTFSRDSSSDSLVPTELRCIVDDTIVLCESRLKQNEVKLYFETNSCEGIKINCRATEISQVLMNLLTNSFDEVRGQPDAWIRINVQQSVDYVIIDVVDSGPGVKGSNISKIFDPFFTTKDVGQGTGLGLGISLSLMKQHGGSLSCEQDESSTTFRMKFPRLK
jgi:two-component system phosphate regulon sensor histidine kinase PhoR